MNFLYDPLPSAVVVGGRFYKIRTDFREWLKISDFWEKSDVSEQEKAMMLLSVFQEMPPANFTQDSMESLILFFRHDENPMTDSSPTKKSTEKILSWSYDAAYIYSAFLAVYRINLLEIPEMHWHVFLNLFNTLPEDTPIKQRMFYRSVNLSSIKDKNERKRIRKIQKVIRIPQEKINASQTGDFFG